MEKRKKTSPFAVFLMILLVLLAAAMIGAGIYLIFFKNKDAFERQAEEKDLADQYVEDLILMAEDPEAYEALMEERRQKRKQREAAIRDKENATGDEEEEETVEEEETDDFDWLSYSEYADENYYSRDGVVYTPDYAKGYIDCRLEVPTAGISRGVYAGTWEEINFNLDIWMVTTSRPDYELGTTHYCIYGHNHTVQDLSFNNLQKVQVGEYFYLTGTSGRYTYEITNVFAVSREDATKNYVDNFTLGSDKCYIITCGRDDGVRNFRYLDLIVEGTLTEHLTIAEYAKQLRDSANND